jgi:thiol peroxidase
MAEITLGGNPIHTNGELPAVGDQAPEFVLSDADLKDHRLADFSGKRVLLNIFPSIDTGVCATSTRSFNQHAKQYPDAEIVTVSADLPFALGRFCQAEDLANVRALSMLRNRDFANDYGVAIIDGPMAGLTARAVVVLDQQGKVVYTELVPEIAQEPDYDKALAALAG